MASSDDQAWQAAITAWHALDLPKQAHAMGFIASQDAALVAGAALAAASAEYPDTTRAVGAANTAIRRLDTRECRDVLHLLAMQAPALLLAAIAEAGNA